MESCHDMSDLVVPAKKVKLSITIEGTKPRWSKMLKMLLKQED